MGYRGDLTNGWVQLAGGFPPTLNKDDDATTLRESESPDAYGLNAESDGQLRTGSIPTGTARSAPTRTVTDGNLSDWLSGEDYTIHDVVVETAKTYICKEAHQAGTFSTDLAAGKWVLATFYFYLDRLWTWYDDKLLYGAPRYETAWYPQDAGVYQLDADIVTVLPAFDSAIWIVTATGSVFLNNASDPRTFFSPGRFVQEMRATTATHAMTLDGKPVVANARGVFMWNGNAVEELTRPIRGTLGNFGPVAITANYEQSKIVGTAKFAIDMAVKPPRLLDYGTSGFRFTTRTLSQLPGYQPMQVKMVAFSLSHLTDGSKKFRWQTKIDGGKWYDEEPVNILPEGQNRNRLELEIENSPTACREFAVRIKSMDSDLAIRGIDVEVLGLAQEAVTE